MPYLLPALLAVAQPAAVAPDQVVYFDSARQIVVRSLVTADHVEFSARLPAGWIFSVGVDGDQDGKWGDGPFSGSFTLHPSRDRVYAVGSDGAFCPQYALSSVPRDPDRVFASTLCGAAPSHGSVELSRVDAAMRAATTYRIPLDELFGPFPDAHLQVCVWDTHLWTCQSSPARPMVLHRPLPG